MAQRFPPNGNFWSKAVTWSISFFLLLESVNSQAYNFTTLAADFCASVARGKTSTCDCTDTVIEQGASSWCSYNRPLGPGIAIVGTPNLTGWHVVPTYTATTINISHTCDATLVNHSITCPASTEEKVIGSTTTTYTVGVGLEVGLEADLPFDKASTTVSFSFEEETSTTKGHEITIMAGCGPGPEGQAAGTCGVYTKAIPRTLCHLEKRSHTTSS